MSPIFKGSKFSKKKLLKLNILSSSAYANEMRSAPVSGSARRILNKENVYQRKDYRC